MSKTRNSTIEVLKIGKSVHYPALNYGEFAIIKSDAGLNSHRISVKDYVSLNQVTA